MKFSFPFFGKKSRSLDREVEDVLPKDVPLIVEEKPSINWNAVEVDLMPGFAPIPEQITEPAGPVRTQAEEGLKYSNQGSQAVNVDTQPADGPFIAGADPLKPLQIDDLMVSKPLTISEEIPKADPAPTLNDIVSAAPIEKSTEASEPEKAIEAMQPEPTESEPHVFIANPTSALDDPIKPAPFEKPEEPVEQQLLESEVAEPEPVESIAPVVPSAFITSPAPAIEIASNPLPIEALKEAEPMEPEPSVVSTTPAPTPAPTPTPPIAAPAEVAYAPMLMTRQDVIAAYKLFLNRLPESFEVMQTRVNSSAEANLIDFSLSDEFIKRSDLPAIIFPIAKKVIEAQAKEQSPSQAPTQP